MGESYKPLTSGLTPGPGRDDTGHQRKEGTQAEDVCVTHAASDLAYLAWIRHVHVPALFDDLRPCASGQWAKPVQVVFPRSQTLQASESLRKAPS